MAIVNYRFFSADFNNATATVEIASLYMYPIN